MQLADYVRQHSTDVSTAMLHHTLSSVRHDICSRLQHALGVRLAEQFVLCLMQHSSVRDALDQVTLKCTMLSLLIVATPAPVQLIRYDAARLAVQVTTELLWSAVRAGAARTATRIRCSASRCR